jgi:hypothetical protein
MTYSIQRSGLEFIEDEVRRGGQSWTRETTVRWSGFTIRTHINNDSYDKQSRIYSEVWSQGELSWQTVQRLSGVDHGPALGSAYEDDDSKVAARSNDLMNRMIGYVQVVLEGAAA